MRRQGLLKKYASVLSVLLRFIDAAFILIAGLMAYSLRFQTLVIPSKFWMAFIIAVLLTLLIFPYFKLYESHRIEKQRDIFQSLFFANVCVFFILIALAALFKINILYSRTWFVLWFVMAVSLFYVCRFFIYAGLRMLRKKGWNQRFILLIGSGDFAQSVLEHIQTSTWLGYSVRAFIHDQENEMPWDLSRYVKDLRVDEVWLAYPLQEIKQVDHLLDRLRFAPIVIRQAIDIYGTRLFNYSMSHLSGLPVLNIQATPMIGFNHLIKNAEDYFLASVIFILVSPLFLFIAMLIKLTSKGPVFYRQKRASFNGREFDMLKFRTMPVGAEEKTGPVWAKQNDNRSTKIGVFLRRSSLDELPQLINVLKGEMSLVGPRPERPEFIEQFKYDIPLYMQKHLVKGGITGLAQIHGWRGNTDLKKRIECDIDYVENWSLGLDLKIIFLTVFKGFFNRNAY